jgi:protein phosphatase
MGAHAVGELASKLAVDLIPHTYQKYAGQGAAEALERAFAEANTTIHNRGRHNVEFEGMGTTSTALLVRPEGAWIGHVGDSRAYRIRGGKMEQLSYDHSLQWELARRQRVHPDKIDVPTNVIVRSLGPEETVQIDIEGPHPVLPGDIYLLCSDGLSGQVGDQEMGAVASTLPLDEACQLLVDLANLRGGPDNITVVMARVPGQSTEEMIKAASAPPTLPREPWHTKLFTRLPWPGIGLGSGVTLAIMALIFLSLGFPMESYLSTFFLSVVTLVAGLWGVFRAHGQENAPKNHKPKGPPRAYRQTPCRIDKTMLEKLAQAETGLQERALEKGWEVDWQAHKQHLAKAREHLTAGDLPGGFRERCRAIAEVTKALRKQWTKGEVFIPVWEKRSRFG